MLDAPLARMRTSLCIHDEVLEAARVPARQRRTGVGTVISALVLRSLARPSAGVARSPAERHGQPLLPRREALALELVNQWPDDRL